MDHVIDSFDWNHARALVVVADHGSYSAAAKVLRTTQPTVGRQIAALEEQLSVTLVEREGRGIALTPAALALVEHAREMGEGARRLALAASGRSEALEGIVTLSVGEIIAVHVLPPVLAEIRARYPGLQLDVIASNTTSDLRRREADVALRNFRPDDEELIAVRLPEWRGGWYAASSYLDDVGRPGEGGDAGALTLIGFDRSAGLIDMMRGYGVALRQEQFGYTSENQTMQWELARRGYGAAVMVDRVASADPGMERVFEWTPWIPVPMWLTTHRAVRTSRRVRAVFDVLREAFAE